MVAPLHKNAPRCQIYDVSIALFSRMEKGKRRRRLQFRFYSQVNVEGFFFLENDKIRFCDFNFNFRIN